MSLNGHSLKDLSIFTLYTLLAKYVKDMFSNSTINITKQIIISFQHLLTRGILDLTRKTTVVMTRKTTVVMTRKTGVVMVMTRKTTVVMTRKTGVVMVMVSSWCFISQ